MNASQKRAMRVGLQKRMSREAERRRCPKCERGAAVKVVRDSDFVAKACRFCGHEWGYFIEAARDAAGKEQA